MRVLLGVCLDCRGGNAGVYFKERGQDRLISRYCFLMKYRMLFRPQDVEKNEILDLLQVILKNCNDGNSFLPDIYVIQLRKYVRILLP